MKFIILGLELKNRKQEKTFLKEYKKFPLPISMLLLGEGNKRIKFEEIGNGS